MLRRFPLLLLLMILCVFPLMLYAQGAPEQIDAALASLSEGVGQTITLNDLENWRWAQDNYPDTSLGCPREGTAYAQVVSLGYKFLLTYRGKTYDYRVSADSRTVILCTSTGGAESPSATATPITPDTIDSTVPCAAPEPGVVYMPTRLTTGIQARVAAGPPNNQRSAPGIDAPFLGDIPGGSVVKVVAGPECTEGLVWWQVDYDGRVGWTVEGRDGAYWLETIPGLPLPENLPAITVENGSSLIEISRTENNVIAELSASPSGSMVAVLGGLGTDGVWLYDLSQLDTAPRLLRGTVQLLSLDFNADGSLLLLGDVDGGVRLWDTNPQAALLETTYLGGHQSNTSAVAYSPDGALIASVGSVANTTAEVDTNNAILLWDVATVKQQSALGGHTARVNALDFSPDNALLLSVSGEGNAQTHDNTVRLWNVAAGTQAALLEGHSAPVRDAEFSPDGALIASASIDGQVILWDAATHEQSKELQASGAPIIALAFSPDGKLLATAGGDPNVETSDFSIQIWNLESGEVIATLVGHTGAVGSLDFTPDGSVLVSVSEDHSIRFWGVTDSVG
jgi:roadblock/LC7 domain-containing protein